MDKSTIRCTLKVTSLLERELDRRDNAQYNRARTIDPKMDRIFHVSEIEHHEKASVLAEAVYEVVPYGNFPEVNGREFDRHRLLDHEYVLHLEDVLYDMLIALEKGITVGGAK